MVARHRAAIRWLEDWQDRDGVIPSMLLNLAVSLRARGRTAESHEVSLRSLKLSEDYATPHHRIWLALDDLIEGDGDAAASRLEGIEPARGDTIYGFLFRLAHILLERRRAAPADRAAVLKSTTRQLREAARATPLSARHHAATVLTYRRTVRRMARDHGLVGGWLWRIAWDLRAPRVHT